MYQISDGWDPLVKFLDLKERSGRISCENSQTDFMQLHTMMWKLFVWRSFKNLIKVGAFMTAVVGVVLYIGGIRSFSVGLTM